MSRYFRSVDVWEREDSRIICYRCFELIPDGGFCVQSADFYSNGSEERGQSFNRQFLELLSGQDPADRSHVFGTLEEAISAHKQYFA
jgi:hypothetical protein